MNKFADKPRPIKVNLPSSHKIFDILKSKYKLHSHGIFSSMRKSTYQRNYFKNFKGHKLTKMLITNRIKKRSKLLNGFNIIPFETLTLKSIQNCVIQPLVIYGYTLLKPGYLAWFSLIWPYYLYIDFMYTYCNVGVNHLWTT